MFQHILIPLDGSELAEQIIAPAKRVADDSASRFTLLRSVPPVSEHIEWENTAPSHLFDDEYGRNEARAYLEQVAAHSFPGSQVEIVVVTDADPAGAILDCVRTHQVDLVALATHGRSGLQRLVQGSVAEQVMRHISVPLLSIRPAGLKHE